jgi:hypothetical protein
MAEDWEAEGPENQRGDFKARGVGDAGDEARRDGPKPHSWMNLGEESRSRAKKKKPTSTLKFGPAFTSSCFSQLSWLGGGSH